MERIIETYYLLADSKLVNFQEGTNGVDCWFDSFSLIQHRCLSFEDFAKIRK
jgi:hypothetical protein